MKASELDYSLPEALVAQRPCEKRDESRLMVLDRTTHTIGIDAFRNIASYLRKGDCIVMNDTRVIRARLKGRKPTGGRVEVFLLHEVERGVWEALVRPSGKVKPNTTLRITPDVEVTVHGPLPGGRRRVAFNCADVLRVLEESGEVPLPPYIRRDHPDASDLRRYQTIYARVPGAVAAPTAGLHFTPELIGKLEEKGVRTAFITLHVGIGTFRPVRTENVLEHEMHSEFVQVSADTAKAISEAPGKVVAIGTTTARALESAVVNRHSVTEFRGETRLFIKPGYEFKVVDRLVTNFHLPKSTLLILVSAFAGTNLVREAYNEAVAQRYRFLSFGDAMLII